MAFDQAAFNATVQAVANNIFNFANSINSAYSIVNGVLDLHAQNINDIDAGALATALQNNTALSTLHLYGNAINDSGAQALATALQINNKLSYLDLGKNTISFIGASALATALRTNTALSVLYLYNNIMIGDTGASALAAALEVNTALRSLSLYVSCSIGDAGAEAFAITLRVNNALNALYLGNDISDAGAKALAASLQVNSALTTLYLAGNAIGVAGAQALAVALQINTSLAYLELSSNAIGDAGAEAFATALKINTSLTNLGLSVNAIGDAGAQALANALQSNSSLLVLTIPSNAIGDVGAEALAAALQINTSLIYLALSSNAIGNAGAQALATALQANTALAFLELAGNAISDTGASALVTAVQINESLTYLGLTSNPISLQNLTTIAGSITRNQQSIQLGPVYNNVGAALRASGANTLKILQGGQLTLGPANIAASGINSTPSTFNITDIAHGEFINVGNGKPIRQFSQADINNGLIKVQHDGSDSPFSYTITARNGTMTTLPHPGAVIFIHQPNPPMLSKNQLTLIKNQSSILTTNNLLASFDGVTPLPGLSFNVFNVTGGQFQLVNTTQALNSFSQTLLINNQIEFACDDSGEAPSFSAQASDGNHTSAIIPANITYFLVAPTSTSTTTTTTISTTSTRLPHPPIVVNPIANQTITVGDPFTLEIPNNTFSDPDGDALRLSLSLANGQPLPPGLIFNATSDVLHGTVVEPQTDLLRLTASDIKGLNASLTFQLQAVAASTTTAATSSTHASSADVARVNTGLLAGTITGAFGIGALITVAVVAICRRHSRTDTKVTPAAIPLVTMTHTSHDVQRGDARGSVDWGEHNYSIANQGAVQYGAPESRSLSDNRSILLSAPRVKPGMQYYEDAADTRLEVDNANYGFVA